MATSSAVFIARIYVRKTSKRSQETHYLASILSDTSIKSSIRNISCAQGKWSLHSRWNFTLNFMSMVTNADQRKWRQRRISAVFPTYLCLRAGRPADGREANVVLLDDGRVQTVEVEQQDKLVVETWQVEETQLRHEGLQRKRIKPGYGTASVPTPSLKLALNLTYPLPKP